MTYLLQYDILQQHVTYLLRYDILQQHLTYLLRYGISQQYVTYLLRYDKLQQCVTYLPHEETGGTFRVLFTRLADLYRYRNDVMCFGSLQREYIFAPFLLAIRIFSRHFNYWNQCRLKSSTAACSWCMSDSLRHWKHTGSYHSWGFHRSRKFLSDVRQEF